MCNEHIRSEHIYYEHMRYELPCWSEHLEHMSYEKKFLLLSYFYETSFTLDIYIYKRENKKPLPRHKRK
jgi:hypothetical protein